MGFSRLKQLATWATAIALVSGLPAIAQTTPSASNYNQTVVSTTFQNDVVVTGNHWTEGAWGNQAATSGNWAIINPAPSLGQNSTLTLPDPGASTGNILLDQGVTSAITIQHVTVPLTAANIIAMYTTPVALIAAGATGTCIIVHKVLFTMTTTSTAFTGGTNVEFQLGTTTHGAGTLTTAAIAAAVVQAGAGTSYTTVIPVSYTALPNTGLYISNTGSAFASGTGTALVDIWYSIK